ncbi:CAP-Gly domain-containing linker protein 1 [Trichinella sp. T9]|nr:CAP-Gly domain-containing linker protein 1 [Trichinella sp. T9]KRX58178.1 CAP-Gly domain-containing linker protein 1 [Trichinella sp. T9]
MEKEDSKKPLKKSAIPRYAKLLTRINSKESLLSVSSCVASKWLVGDRCYVGGTVPGRIAFVGDTRFGPGEWAGIVLDEPVGKNNGSVAGVMYFQCAPNYGLFCRLSKLSKQPVVIQQPDAASAFRDESQQESASTAAEADHNLRVGDRVSAGGCRRGVLRFLGPTDFAEGIWAGIELDQPYGKNDGSVHRKRYFTCKPLYGLFAPAHKVVSETFPNFDTETGKKTPIVRHNVASIVRTRRNQSLMGSQESLTSLSSIHSSASRRIRLGVNALSTSCNTPLKNDLRRLKSDSLSPNSSSSTPTVTALHNALKEKEQHVEQLIQERDADRSELAQLLKTLEQTKNEVENLREEEKRTADDFRIKIDFLQTALETSEKECKHWREMYETEKQKADDLEFRMEEEMCSKNDLKLRISALEEERNKTESQKLMTMEKYKNLQEEMKMLSAEHDQLKKELCDLRTLNSNAEIDDIKENNSKLEEKCKILMENFDNAQKNNSDLHHMLDQAKQELIQAKEIAQKEKENASTYAEKLKELENSMLKQKILSESNAVTVDRKDSSTSFDMELCRAFSKIKLNETIESHENKKSEEDESSKALLEANMKLAVLEEKLNSEKNSFSNLDLERRNQILQLQQQIEKMNPILESRQKEIDALKLDLSEKVDYCCKVDAELNFLRNEVISLRQPNKQSLSSSKETQTECDGLDTVQQSKVIEFLESIIANEKVEIDRFMNHPGLNCSNTLQENFVDPQSDISALRQLRKFCDVCEIFDAHDTEECELYKQELMNHSNYGGDPLAVRPYCDRCETELSEAKQVRAFPVTLSHSKDRTNNHTRSLQPTHYRNPPSIFKAVRVRCTTSPFMCSSSFPLLIVHVTYEISQLRWSARALPFVLYSPHLGVLLPTVIWFQAVEVYHQQLSSPPGTCFSPASSGLRTNRPCKPPVWSMDFPVAFGTDVAAALDLPSPVPPRSAAPGPAATAVYTLLPTLLGWHPLCGERWTDRREGPDLGGHPNLRGDRWMPSRKGLAGCGSSAPPSHRTAGGRLWSGFWSPRTSGTPPSRARTRRSDPDLSVASPGINMSKIFTPTNQMRHTNVAVVRMKKAGKRFEIACYKNKVLNWRSKMEREVALASSILTLMPHKSSEPLNEVKRLVAWDPRPVLEIYDELASNASTSLATAAHFPTWEQARNTMYYSRSKRYARLPLERDIDEVLQTHHIFTNVSKGELAKKEDLLNAFATDNQTEICKVILEKGELQISEKERKLYYESSFKEIANIIAGMCVDIKSKRPYSQAMIETALHEIHFSVRPRKSSKQQALDIIPRLKQHMPIDRAKMVLRVECPAELAKAAKEKLNEWVDSFELERWEENGDLLAIVIVEPSYFRQIDSLVRSPTARGVVDVITVRQIVEEKIDITEVETD